MKFFRLAAAATALLVPLLASAGKTYNASHSNTYCVTSSTDVATKAQITQLLAALDKLGAADESKLKQWLPANFKRFGIEPNRVKRLVIMPPGKELTGTGVILLSNPADEAEARAVTVKSAKSNSSD